MYLKNEFCNEVKKFNINGVINIGSHYAEELELFEEMCVSNIVLIEPILESYNKILEKIKNKNNILSFNLACSDVNETCEMYVEKDNAGQSCSLLEPVLHKEQYPTIMFDFKETVTCKKLDDISLDKMKYDCIVMDVQGSELKVLKGAVETLKNIKVIYTEVNNDEVYKDCAKINEMDDFLNTFSFKRIYTNWAGVTWGDAIYIRK